MATEKLTREDCLFLLVNKQKELYDRGLTRFPQRSDFSDCEVMAIKAFLGPWSRALEAAGERSLAAITASRKTERNVHGRKKDSVRRKKRPKRRNRQKNVNRVMVREHEGYRICFIQPNP